MASPFITVLIIPHSNNLSIGLYKKLCEFLRRKKGRPRGASLERSKSRGCFGFPPSGGGRTPAEAEIAVEEQAERQRPPDKGDGVEQQEGVVVRAQGVVELHADKGHHRVGERDKGHVQRDDEGAVLLRRDLQQHLDQAEVVRALGNAHERAQDEEHGGPQPHGRKAGDEHRQGAEH